MRPCTVEAYLPQTHLNQSRPHLALDEGFCPLRPHRDRPTYQEPTRLSIERIVTEARFGFVSFSESISEAWSVFRLLNTGDPSEHPCILGELPRLSLFD
jgi:hypothetical protein